MGVLDVEQGKAPEELRRFTHALLRDLQALERILATGMIERGVRRFGAEQELFLVTPGWRPAPVSTSVLDRLPKEGPFTTELGRFNLEINLVPLELTGDCFSQVEAELHRRIGEVRTAAQEEGADVVLTGILPTLSKSDLTYENITPMPRYYALNDAMNRLLRGGAYRLRIIGTDDLIIQHDTVMLEACNTSVQFHLQVTEDEFAPFYNAAQALTGPILAACVNSPLLFGRRLWAETRIALFQQSLDTRSPDVHMRELRPRVRFGEKYVRESVTELFEEDIQHFRVLITGDLNEDPFEVLDRGGVPALRALQLHNGTVYRWNRPCYGVGDGKPHLRIECRVLPSGPTVLDEVANGALWVGAVMGLVEQEGDITARLPFDVAKANFLAASRLGLRAGFYWMDGESVAARPLLTETILPLARVGLEKLGIDDDDIDRYLSVVRARVEKRQTGASWMIRSLSSMEATTVAQRMAALTAGIATRQHDGKPVSEWELATVEEAGDWKPNYRTVEQYMTTTLFTVNEDELLELAAFMMDKNRIRHVLVEDNDHDLVGIVSYRSILRMLASGKNPLTEAATVRDVMHRDPVTVEPHTSTVDAIDIMRRNKVSCLPVTSRGKLVGLVTETDFMPIAYRLLHEKFGED